MNLIIFLTGQVLTTIIQETVLQIIISCKINGQKLVFHFHMYSDSLQINEIYKNMKKIQILLVLLLSATSISITEIPFDSQIGLPNIEVNRFDQKVESHPVDGIYSEYFRFINFEISSLLYIKEGTIQKDRLYDSDAYDLADENSGCQIFPTDFELTSTVGFDITDEISHLILVEDPVQIKEAAIDVTGFASMTNGKILQFKASHQVSLGLKVDNKEKLDMVGYLNVTVPQSPTTFLIDFEGYLYIVSNQKVLCYDRQTKTSKEVTGYGNHSDLVRARKMFETGKKEKQVYVLGKNSVTIYEIISPFIWAKVQSIPDVGFQAFPAQGNIYENNFFYLSGHEQLVVIDNTDRESPKLSKLSLNGTCYDIQKFMTTMHVSCIYGRNRYIAEFNVRQDKIVLNRYFTNVELPSASWIRHIGGHIMLIVGDEEIRLLNYAANRNLLLDMDRRQPNFNFQFKDGFDIKYLNQYDEKSTFSLLAIYNHRLQIMRIKTSPAELYCKFPDDEPGKIRSLLVKFNTTQCPILFDKNPLSHYGNTENICQVSFPIELHSKSKQIQGKAGNAISVSIIVMIVLAVILVSGCGVKVIKGKEMEINKMIEDLKKAKKRGYSSEPKPI